MYETASKLAPSQTAQRAKERVTAFDRLPEIIEAVAECRTLQRCHEKYQIAETIAETDPTQASRRYQWIVEHSPKDSRVFQEAVARLEANQR